MFRYWHPLTLRLTFMQYVFLLCCALFAAKTYAAAPKIIDNYRPAFKVEGELEYPSLDLQESREGWVDLSFTVKANGKIEDIVVMASNGNIRMEKAAMKSAAKWKYKPAQSNGVAIDSHLHNVYTAFILADANEITRGFKDAYEKAALAFKQGDDNASKWLTTLNERNAHTLIEEGLRAALNADVYESQHDIPAFIDALWMAHERLALKNYNQAFREKVAQKLMVALANNGQYAEAIRVYDKSKRQLPGLFNHVKMKTLVTQLNKALQENEMISSQADTLSMTYVSRDISHPAFVIHDVNGNLTNIDIQCQNKRASMPVQEEGMVAIPSTWKVCKANIYGDKHSRFTFTQLDPKQLQ